jgi:integrase/recombinase XerD
MVLKCLYYLGLKSNELTRMAVKDVDFEKNVARIQGRNARDVYIPGEFTFELEKYVRGMPPESLVFTGRGPGSSMSNRHVRRIVKQYAGLADVRNCEEIKPHTLRISYATHLRRDGLSVRSIQGILGHARRETTYMYTHGLNRIGNGYDDYSDSDSDNNPDNNPDDGSGHESGDGPGKASEDTAERASGQAAGKGK